MKNRPLHPLPRFFACPRFDAARLVRVVNEIEGSESKPAINPIHHPGKSDGVFNTRLNDYISAYFRGSWLVKRYVPKVTSQCSTPATMAGWAMPG